MLLNTTHNLRRGGNRIIKDNSVLSYAYKTHIGANVMPGRINEESQALEESDAIRKYVS